MINSEEYKEARRNFWQKYTNNFLPQLEMCEKERKIRLFWGLFAIFLSFAFVIGYFIVCHLESEPIEGRIINIIILGFLIYHWIKKSFEKKVKRKIMQRVCKCFEYLFWIENYNKTEKFEQLPNFNETGLTSYYTTFNIDDAFVGEHKNVKFDIIESELIRGCGKNSKTIFKGVFILLDMNKNFNTHTIITQDSLSHTSPLNNLHHTELEDIQFEKRYDVFTDNDVEARYLITPSFMERLNNIELCFNGKISCAFYKEKLILAIRTKHDLFSICSLLKPTYDSKQFETMFNEIYSLIELIEYFKLDQKIGL